VRLGPILKRAEPLKRGFWGLVSQGVNTLGNLLATFFVASNCSSVIFGAWAVGYACVLAVLPISRSVGSTPMLLTSHRKQIGTESGAVASSFWLGLTAGLGLGIVGLIVGGNLATALLAFSVAMPLFLFQDAIRYVFISRKQTSRTALIDATWLVMQIAGFGVLLLTGTVTAPAITLVWAGSALLSCVCALRSGALCVGPLTAYRYFEKNKWAVARLTPEAILQGVSTNGIPVILAAVAGLSSTAALRAGQTLFGPLNILVAGVSPVITVEAVSILRSGGSQWRIVSLWSVTIAVFGGVVSTIAFLIPEVWGHALLGNSWDLVPIVLLPLAIQAIIRGPFVCGPLILRARHLLNEALVLRVINSVVQFGAPVIGIFLAGARGAAWGIAISAAIRGVLAIVWLRQTEDRFGHKMADNGEGDEPNLN